MKVMGEIGNCAKCGEHGILHRTIISYPDLWCRKCWEEACFPVKSWALERIVP
jgi:hypothetical protein